MRRETFIQILSAALAEADGELVAEAKGLIFWRERAIREEKVKLFSPGMTIEWADNLGNLHMAPIHHLNRYSVTVHESHPTEGYRAVIVPLERIKTEPPQPLPF